MVYGIIAKGIYQAARVGLRAYGRYTKAESKLFNYAYKGYPTRIRRGVVHGHIAGQVGGYFITKDNEVTGNGVQETTYGPSSNPLNKTYRGSAKRHSRRYKTRCPPRYKRRQSYSRRYN